MIKYSTRRFTKQPLRLTPTSPLTCQRSNDQRQIFATIVQQSQTKRSSATKVAGHDDQSHDKSGGPIITGTPSQPSNHRPISSILIWYKISSQFFFLRPQPTPDASQSGDQAGSRPGYSTSDHLFTFQQFREGERERERH